MSERRAHGSIRFTLLFFLASAVFPSLSRAQVPVFRIATEDSSIKFSVKASVAINGTFDKWDAALTFTSTDVTTGVLAIKVQADSINTGSGMKDDELKGKDFFDVKEDLRSRSCQRRLSGPAPTPSMCRATSRFVERLNPRR